MDPAILLSMQAQIDLLPALASTVMRAVQREELLAMRDDKNEDGLMGRFTVAGGRLRQYGNRRRNSIVGPFLASGGLRSRIGQRKPKSKALGSVLVRTSIAIGDSTINLLANVRGVTGRTTTRTVTVASVPAYLRKRRGGGAPVQVRAHSQRVTIRKTVIVRGGRTFKEEWEDSRIEEETVAHNVAIAFPAAWSRALALPANQAQLLVASGANEAAA